MGIVRELFFPVSDISSIFRELWKALFMPFSAPLQHQTILGASPPEGGRGIHLMVNWR